MEPWRAQILSVPPAISPAVSSPAMKATLSLAPTPCGVKHLDFGIPRNHFVLVCLKRFLRLFLYKCSSFFIVFVKRWQKQGDPVDVFCLSLWFLAVQCPALQELENGLTSCGDEEGRKFSYENTCSFSCAPGYQLVGPTTITCTSAATWTESAPRCAGECVPTFSWVFCKEVFLAFRD